MRHLIQYFRRQKRYNVPNMGALKEQQERTIDPTQINDLDSLIASLVEIRETFGNVPLNVSTLKLPHGEEPALDAFHKAVRV